MDQPLGGGVGLALFHPKTWGKALALGLDQGDGYGLGLGIDLDAERVIGPSLGTPPGATANNVDGPGGLFAANQVFGPTPIMDSWVDELGSGVSFAKHHAYFPVQ